MKCVFDGLEGLSRNPFFGGVTAVLGVLTGALGSLYTAEIKSSFPFVWWPVAFTHEATLFWLLLIVFLFMFFGTQWAQNRATNRAQQDLVGAQQRLISKADQLVTKSDELESLIRTMPPEDFLAKFDQLYKHSFSSALVGFSEDARIEDIEKSIRIILDCIVTLAQYFDGNPQNIRYGANIMLFHSCRDMNKVACYELRSRLMFTPDDTDLAALIGVLDLLAALSTTTATADPSPDEQLVPFALPVHRPAEKSVNGCSRYRILPGAPEAFQLRRLAGFRSVSEIETWCRDKGDFPPGTVADMISYFRTGAGQNIKSFCSVPLEQSGSEQPIGVLNIHRDAEDMLKQNGVLLFIPLTTPFRLLLVDLIRWYYKRQE